MITQLSLFAVQTTKPQVAVDVDDAYPLPVLTPTPLSPEFSGDMRGLTFPNAAIYERAESEDHGTPFSQVDDIPIDPALAGLPLDPALLEEDVKMHFSQVSILVYLPSQC